MIEILTVGDELVSGRTLDENARSIAAMLYANGFFVSRMTSVGDAAPDICRALLDHLPETRVMVITGGLGPTDDDRTAQAAAKAFNRRLVTDEAALRAMEQKYQTLGRPMPELARKQALVPEGSTVIPNPVGIACGFSVVHNGVHFLFLPGVPEEVKAMLEESVLGHIREICGGAVCVMNRTLKVFGLWESGIQERLRGHLPESPAVNIGYYPQYPEVSIIISGKGTHPDQVRGEVERFEKIICEQLGEYVYATDGRSLEEIVGGLLIERSATLAVAESCTGGLITHRLTNVPGSSAYLERAFIVYSNRAKQELLSVPDSLLKQYGAVSEQVARSMAIGAREHARTTFGLAVTGIAGPSGGTPEKPVGTVYISITSQKRCTVNSYRFSGSREKIKIMTAHVALNLLRRFILEE